MDNLVYMAASLAKQRSAGIESLEERLLAAMKGAREMDYMILDEDTLFVGALAGAIANSEGDDKRQLERQVAVRKALNAARSGVPVNFETLLGGADDDLPPWPCRDFEELWKESSGRVE